jgi:ATP-dependent Zn protease
MMGSRGFGLALVLVVVLIVGLALLWTYTTDGTEASAYPYSQLLADAAAGNVEAITQDGTRLTVRMRGESEPRLVTVASESINVYAEVCAAAGAPLGQCPIQYTVVEESAAGQWVGLLVTSLLPVLLIGSFIFFMMRQAQRGKTGV